MGSREFSESNVVVLYHAACTDGFVAAWLLHRTYPLALFHPVQYGDLLPQYLPLDGAEVWILDFCFPLDVMREIGDRAYRVFLIDHHVSQTETVRQIEEEKLVTVWFTPEQSGAKLTWVALKSMGFFKEQEAPALVEYVEDRDLWKWELKDSREISAALNSYPFDFPVWDGLYLRPISSLVDEGRAILRYQNQYIDKLVSFARSVVIAGHEVPCLNTTILRSQVGERLCQGKPFSATYFDRHDGQRVWSFRSSKEGLDVSLIAKKFAGGGHKHAAGCTLEVGYFNENRGDFT